MCGYVHGWMDNEWVDVWMHTWMNGKKGTCMPRSWVCGGGGGQVNKNKSNEGVHE